MRTNHIILGLAALLSALSCRTIAEPAPAEATEAPPITFTCTFGPETKVSIAGDGKTQWEVGDKILVHGGNNGSVRSIVTLEAADISADGKKATISVAGIEPYDRSDKHYKSTIYASYPADAVAAGNLYYYARFNSTNHPLMAAYNDGNTLVFYNLCGLISFQVYGDFDSYILTGNAGETVGYSFYQSYLVLKDDDTPRLDWNYTLDGGTSGPLTSISGPVTADGTTLNHICIPNGANFTDGFTLSLLKNGVTVKQASTSSALNLTRNNMVNLGNITSHLKTPVLTHCRDEYLGQRPMVIAYLTEYTSSSSLDATYLTHINYCHGRFVHPETGDGGITIAETGLLADVLALKASKPTLKVLLMIGGWGSHANGFSMMARSAAKRAEFCAACKAHIDTYGLDGIDIDWEYPTYPAGGNAASEEDTANFNLLVRELRQAIGDTKIISVASSASAQYIDWATAIQYVDYVNVMTYDMGDPPYHNSTLYHSALTKSRSCEESVEAHRVAGVPLARQVLGVPFYGHGTDPYASDVKYKDIPAILAATTGPYAGKNIYHWDDVAKVPYLTDTEGTMLLGYDNAESVTYKGQFVLDNNMLGAMFWEYRHDDAAGTLRKALYNAIYPPE